MALYSAIELSSIIGQDFLKNIVFRENRHFYCDADFAKSILP